MDFERLISDYFDDALTPQEVDALFQWIRSDPAYARQFASAALLHRRLEHRLSAMCLLENSLSAPAIATASPPSQRNLKKRAWRGSRHVWGSAAAILLVITVLAFIAWPARLPAHLMAAENAIWQSGGPVLKPGDRVPNRKLVLDSGVIELAFDNGSQAIIEGPARFTVTDANAVTLEQGALTAIVTKAGRGFCVSTSTARVTDLGTEFGVRASGTTSRVMVFTGRVSVDRDGVGSHELVAGNAVEISTAGISPIPFNPAAFIRVMPSESRPLDLVDLLAGGDGTGSASGVGINGATGARQTKAVTIRMGDHRYRSVKVPRVLDGCFIPDGRMPVDSAGHVFDFPPTSLFSYGLIWGGPNVPWEGELPIATTLPGDTGASTSRVLVMHSNNGFTLNLDSVRALHASATITGFRARVGNSYRAALNSRPARPLASVHLLVDGSPRFERRGFANTDQPFEIDCPLSDNDHFLTLATTDGGDGNACDWVLWTRPELVVQHRAK
jgi:hypothetical protein